MKTRLLLIAAAVLTAGTVHVFPQSERVAIRVDADERKGPMTPMWAFFGYDEPNYTYMKDGQALLTELAALSPAPVYVRAHNLLTTGDGTPALKWGSTNAYTEDASGRPIYDWTIVDRIFDEYIKRGMKPLVEIGFMPQALSMKPEPYKHSWRPGAKYGEIFTGWAYPPRDYEKWRELVYQWARHATARYGRAEVESWYWQVWNEPDIGYWQGTREEYFRLHDYAADGLRRALPTARIGGPHTTNPNNERAREFLRAFLEHCVRGTNYATGKTGSPLDYIGFHAKGAPRVVEGHVRMNMANQLRAISDGFRTAASFPELRRLPVIIGESDPEGCAACSVATNPENAYRNGTMYSSYTAAQIARTYEIADAEAVQLRGSVTWAFEFENQPYFAGFRDLATNGIDKPVLNVFRMLGKMAGDRVAVESSGARRLADVLESSIREAPDVNALASRNGQAIAVLVWNYHDDDVPRPAAGVDLTIRGVPVPHVTVTHYRVDENDGNSYAAWKRMGSPQSPTAAQIAELRTAAALKELQPAAAAQSTGGAVTLSFDLPAQGVSLVRLTW